MGIIRDGEKFACENCIKGHRVSSCTHIDRPLLHVNRKGRPVSQCQHCRGLRKARATHVKCECGERRHSRTNSAESVTMSDGGCQCFLGKRCTCALKKDPVEAEDPNLLSAPSPASYRPFSRPAIPQRRSESGMARYRSNMQASLPKLQNTSQQFRQPHPLRQTHLGVGYHMVNHSVDSLPLNISATHTQRPIIDYSPLSTASPWDVPSATSEQGYPFFGPRTPTAMVSKSPNLEFPVPVAREVSRNARSPFNPNRYSMNDFSILGVQQDIGQPGPVQQQGIYSEPAKDDQAVSFQDWSMADAFSAYQSSHAQSQSPPPPGGFEEGTPQPDLSRSSTGTASDTLDMRNITRETTQYDMSQESNFMHPATEFFNFEESNHESYQEQKDSPYDEVSYDFRSPATFHEFDIDTWSNPSGMHSRSYSQSMASIYEGDLCESAEEQADVGVSPAHLSKDDMSWDREPRAAPQLKLDFKFPPREDMYEHHIPSIKEEFS